MQGWRGVDFAHMTSPNSVRSRWIRLLILAVVAIAVAHALDAAAWRSARLLTVNDKDWGRLLRSMGYLPTWGIIALCTAVAPIGTAALVSPLASAMMSGVTPKYCAANGAPSRPNPLITSSKISRMPCAVHSARSRSR